MPERTAVNAAGRVGIIGAPVEAGAGRRGCIMGPAALRTAGLVGALEDLDFAVEDLGDVAPSRPLPAIDAADPLWTAKRPDEIAGWTRVLSGRCYDVIRTGAIPIVLGGDHSLAMGSVNGMARHARDLGRPLCVLWLDAHADFNTPVTSPSGNMHGMSAAFLCGEPGLEGVIGEEERVTIDPAHLHLFGLRSIDRAERDLLRRRGIDVVDMRMIDEFGVLVPLRRVLDAVAAAGALLHVSLDVDFLEPAIAPGVGTLVPGGATYREAHLVMELLHDSGLVTSLDLVELNPFLDDRGMTARLLVDLTASLFGRRVLDRPSPGGRMAYRAD
ncbi:MAG TPA: arginase [Enterovirga sp.]